MTVATILYSSLDSSSSSHPFPFCPLCPLCRSFCHPSQTLWPQRHHTPKPLNNCVERDEWKVVLKFILEQYSNESTHLSYNLNDNFDHGHCNLRRPTYIQTYIHTLSTLFCFTSFSSSFHSNTPKHSPPLALSIKQIPWIGPFMSFLYSMEIRWLLLPIESIVPPSVPTFSLQVPVRFDFPWKGYNDERIQTEREDKKRKRKKSSHTTNYETWDTNSKQPDNKGIQS